MSKRALTVTREQNFPEWYQAAVRDGDMVAAWLKSEQETTLKHLYREGSRVRLQPANRTMRPIETDASNVEVQGKVIAAIRALP